MSDHYIWFTAEQGDEHKMGFLILQAELTEENVMKAIAQTAELPEGEVTITYAVLTKEQYEEMRGETIRELGPADITNISQKDKMH